MKLKQSKQQARTVAGKRVTALKISIISIISIVAVWTIPTTATTTTTKSGVVISTTHTVDSQGNTVTIFKRGGKK